MREQFERVVIECKRKCRIPYVDRRAVLRFARMEGRQVSGIKTGGRQVSMLRACAAKRRVEC